MAVFSDSFEYKFETFKIKDKLYSMLKNKSIQFQMCKTGNKKLV